MKKAAQTARPSRARGTTAPEAPESGSPNSEATVSRPALLVDGSEAAFRRFIHAFLAYCARVEHVRAGFGDLLGVTGIQYEILMVVLFQGHDHDVSVSDVARHLHRSGAFITIETGKLARRGWLEKRPDPADRRRVLLTLKDMAYTRLRALAPAQRQVNDTLFAVVEEGQFAQLVALFEGLVACGDDAVELIQRLRRDAAPE